MTLSDSKDKQMSQTFEHSSSGSCRELASLLWKENGVGPRCVWLGTPGKVNELTTSRHTCANSDAL